MKNTRINERRGLPAVCLDTDPAQRPRKEHKHDTRAGRRRRTQIGGQFSAHLIDMLRSPAWCVLSLSARRVLDRIEIEHADHGGTENSRLPITYDHFEDYGIHRHAIAPAIREAVALGFLEVTEAGRAGNAEWRKPNLFRLTYRHTDEADPTNNWKKIASTADAIIIAAMARKSVSSKTKSQWRKTPILSGGNHHRNGKSLVAETTTKGHSAETTTTSISWGGTDSSTGSRSRHQPSRRARAR